MKKKIWIFLGVFCLTLIVCLSFLLPKYKVKHTFTYEVDKEKGEVTITGYQGDKCPKELEIPDKINGYPVTTIGKHAFEWAEVENITLPKNITTMKEGAFYGCTRLKKVVGIENVEIIESDVFYMCKSLKEMNLSSVKELGEAAFFECSTIEVIEIPEGIKVIPSALCGKMENLRVVILPDSVTTIEDIAFRDCNSLKEIYLSSNVTNISFDPNEADICVNSFHGIEHQLTIYGESGSYVEEYAAKAGIKFVAK